MIKKLQKTTETLVKELLKEEKKKTEEKEK